MDGQAKRKYQVHTDNWEYGTHDDLQLALIKYETVKDWKMSEGVTEDSYVELVYSDDDFEDHVVLKRAMVVRDDERMELGTPQEEGMDFDYWAKWEEMIHGAVEIELRKLSN